MLHARIPDGFFSFGSTGIDASAMQLIIKKLDDPVCSRFMGNPIIDPDFLETTAAHEIRTYETVESVLKRSLPKNKDPTNLLARYKAMILLHDVSDIIKEVIIAATETDPVLKAQCADHIRQYDVTITPLVYRMAMFAKAERNNGIFYDAIDMLRERTLLPDHYGRAFATDEATDFCDRAITAATLLDASMTRFKNWDTPQSRKKTATMMRYYNEIELAGSFAGLQSQIHEKCDGTEYAVTISQYKMQQGLLPTLYHTPTHIQDRINARYEKNIDALIKSAGKDPHKQAMAAGTVMHCFSVSLGTLSHSKNLWENNPTDTVPGERDHHDVHIRYDAMLRERFQKNNTGITVRENAVSLYTEALDDLQHNGVIHVPLHGKTLLSSSDAIRKVVLAPEAHHALTLP